MRGVRQVEHPQDAVLAQQVEQAPAIVEPGRQHPTGEPR